MRNHPEINIIKKEYEKLGVHYTYEHLSKCITETSVRTGFEYNFVAKEIVQSMLQTKTYTKVVNEQEFLFTLIASNENVGPKLISWKQDKGKYTIHLEKYPMMLKHATNRDIYKDKVVALLKKLHSLGI